MVHKLKAGTVALAAMMCASMLFAADTSNEKRLQQGIDMLESKGDLAGALPLFEQAAKSTDRNLAARALLYVGQIQERQGRDNAKATYEDILAHFGNQSEVVAEARKRLTAMGALPSDRFSLRSLGNVQDDTGSLSADGRVMAIIDWDSNGDIALQDTTTGKVTPLPSGRSDLPTAEDEYGEWAAVSPDQSKVLYFWDPNQKNLDYQLRVTSTSSQAHSSFKVLFQLNDEVTWIDNGVWFPDNKSVLITDVTKNDEWRFTRVRIDSDSKPQVIKSMQWRLLRVKGRPSISPDGKYIAYAALSVNPGKAPREFRSQNGNTFVPSEQYIYVLPADGSGPETIVAKSSGINEAPVWTPDGHILFLSDRSAGSRSGTFGLWSVEVVDGKQKGAPSPIRSETGRITPIGASSSGSYYFVQGQGGDDIFAASLANDSKSKATVSRITDVATDSNFAPSWSHDGKRVAFLRQRPAPETTSNPNQRLLDLVVRTLDTGEEQTYSAGSVRLTFNPPIWFQGDGSLLVTANANNTVWRVDLKTHEFRSIESLSHFALPTGVKACALSTDEKVLYVSTEEVNRNNETRAVDRVVGVTSFDMRTGEKKRIYSTHSTASTIGFALDPSAQWLAVIAQPEKSKTIRLMKMAIDGSNFVDLSPATARGDALTWSMDGRKILFRTDNPAKENPLAWISTAGGKLEYPDTNVLGTSVRNISLNPRDPNRLVFTASTGGDVLWRMDNIASNPGGAR